MPPVRQGAQRNAPVLWILAGLAGVLVLLLAVLLFVVAGERGKETPSPVATRAAIWQTATLTAAPGSLAVTATSTASHSAQTATPVPATDEPPPPTALPTATALLPDTPVPPTDTPVPSAQFGRLAFASDRNGKPEIYVVSLPGGAPVRLTNNDADDWLPDWSPDGSRIAFTSFRTGSYDLWVMNGDGGGPAAWVTTAAWDEYARWAPDGQRLSLSTTATTDGVPNSEIFVRRADGSLVQLTHSNAEDQWADWSPDGRIVYTEGFKDDSNWDILVMNGDGSGRTVWLGGATCDVQPTWSPDGQRIAFLRVSRDTNGNGRIDYEDAGDVWVGQAGGGLVQLTSGLWAVTPAWSPDSRWVALTRFGDSNGNGRSDADDVADIWAVPVEGGEAVALVQGPHRDGNPTWTW